MGRIHFSGNFSGIQERGDTMMGYTKRGINVSVCEMGLVR